MPADDITAHPGDGAGPSTSPDRPADDAPALARALHDLTARFRLVLENASDVIVQYDAHGRRALGVAVAAHHVRLRRRRGRGDPRCASSTPTTRARAEAYVEARMRDGFDVIDNHDRVVCADGTRRWATSSARASSAVLRTPSTTSS